MSRVILYKNGTGLYSKLQHWFSGQPYNHVSFYAGRMLNKDWVYEAGFSLSANPVNLSDPNIEIWECSLDLDQSLKTIIDRVSGRSYAFLQILYFVRRKFYESKIGKPFWWVRSILTGTKKVTKMGNWFPRSEICTELWYDVLKEASEKTPDLYNYLNNEFDGNNLYVSDVRDTMLKFKYFKKV